MVTYYNAYGPLPKEVAPLVALIEKGKIAPRPAEADLDDNVDISRILDDESRVKLAFELGCWKAMQAIVEWHHASEKYRAGRGEA